MGVVGNSPTTAPASDKRRKSMIARIRVVLFLFIHDADLLGIVDFDARNIPNQLYFSGGADGLVLEMCGGIVDTGFFSFAAPFLVMTTAKFFSSRKSVSESR